MNEKEIFIAFMKKYYPCFNAENMYKHNGYKEYIINSNIYKRFEFAYSLNELRQTIANTWIEEARNLLKNWKKLLQKIK
jgi:hypothetical protein